MRCTLQGKHYSGFLATMPQYYLRYPLQGCRKTSPSSSEGDSGKISWFSRIEKFEMESSGLSLNFLLLSALVNVDNSLRAMIPLCVSCFFFPLHFGVPSIQLFAYLNLKGYQYNADVLRDSVMIAFPICTILLFGYFGYIPCIYHHTSILVNAMHLIGHIKHTSSNWLLI